ncbi:hypothetical protein [Polaromonas sp. A23]|uniref:hypothetical protein n=1 Tax=Polaromonas sp. A23 TaxID=1944133 RepID=UPI000985894D|nr:hypothetical protein [Polaromonas sp. A23]OOG37232.1 hypothetical protein B0B52_18960 [Polaromonas sp. A23]
MFNSTILQKTIISAVLAFAFAGPGFASSEASKALEEAHRAYYQGESERALLIYEQLAAAGNAEAAERAGFILLRGSGAGVRAGKADLARATTLLAQAAGAGRLGAVFLLGLLDSAD